MNTYNTHNMLGIQLSHNATAMYGPGLKISLLCCWIVTFIYTPRLLMASEIKESDPPN